MSTPDFVRGLAAHGTAPALVFAGGGWSYAELARRVEELAELLGPGRRLVAVEARLSSHAIVAYLAALRAGHTVMLAPADDPIAWASLVERFRPELRLRGGEGRWRIEAGEGGGTPLHEELALLLVTSGSTGHAKAVRLSGGALSANAAAIAQFLGLRAEDCGALFLPLHYSYGLSVLNSHLAVGASLYVTEASILAPGFLDALVARRCTSIAGVPHSYELLEAAGFRARELPDLRFMTVAGGRLAPDVVRRYHDHLAASGKSFFVMYGQTEATARIAYLPPALAGARPGCIGIAIPGGELGLIDERGQEITANGSEGELVYRGPNVMLGYAESRADLGRGAEIGTLRTGDLALREPDGLYRITGRLRRMSKIAGIRLGHDALEAALVDTGIQAAVVGDDHTLLAAYASAQPEEEVRQRLVALTGLTLHHVAALRLAALPRLASGKLDHEALRGRLAGKTAQKNNKEIKNENKKILLTPPV